MYIAYYVFRTDGDGDFCAVIEDGEWTSEELSHSLRKSIEDKLNNSNDGWFKVENMGCDFPDVWDLTTKY
jgi:hypothetical protein